MKSFWRTFALVCGILGAASPASCQFQVNTGSAAPGHEIEYQAERDPESILGSPYFEDEFVQGTVINKTGKPISVPMRYNAYVDAIEFQRDEFVFLMDPKPIIRKVDFGNYELVVRDYVYKGKRKTGFLIRLDSGTVNLYKRYGVSIPPREPDPLGITNYTPKFHDDPVVYYYQIKNQPLYELKKFKKLISKLPSDKEVLSQYLEDQKPSPNKEQEIIDLVRFYNSGAQ